MGCVYLCVFCCYFAVLVFSLPLLLFFPPVILSVKPPAPPPRSPAPDESSPGVPRLPSSVWFLYSVSCPQCLSDQCAVDPACVDVLAVTSIRFGRCCVSLLLYLKQMFVVSLACCLGIKVQVLFFPHFCQVINFIQMDIFYGYTL